MIPKFAFLTAILAFALALPASMTAAAEVASKEKDAVVGENAAPLPADGTQVTPFIRKKGEQKWNGLSPVKVTGRKITVPFPSEGMWELAIRGKGIEAPLESAAPDAVVIVDSVPPEIEWAMPFPAVAGDTQMTIRWLARDMALEKQPVLIDYTTDGGTEWKNIIKDIPNAGQYVWLVPRASAANAKIRIIVRDKAGNVATKESPSFVIDSTPPTIKDVTGKVLPNNNRLELRFTAQDDLTKVRRVRLFVSLDSGKTWNPAPPESVEEKIEDGLIRFGAPEDNTFFFYLVAEDLVRNSTPEPKPSTAPMVVEELKKAVAWQFSKDYYPASITDVIRKDEKLEVHFTLDETEKKELKSVELWATAEGAVNWKKAASGKDSPLVYPGPDGKIGLIVLIKKLDEPFFMQDGRTPSMEFVLDSKQPEGGLKGGLDKDKLDKLDKAQEFDIGTEIMLEWEVADINLDRAPVDISYEFYPGNAAETVQIQKGLDEKGKITWKVPQVENDFFRLILVARDKYGNTLIWKSAQMRSKVKGEGAGIIKGPSLSKTKSVEIRYAPLFVNPERLKKVELYIRKLGKSWTLYGDDKDLVSPFPVPSLEDGYYNLKIILYDDKGRSDEPPKPESEGDLTLLVDTVSPKVAIKGFPESGKVYRGGDKRGIFWEATDDNFDDAPITLIYSLDGVQWIPIIMKDASDKEIIAFNANPTVANVVWALPGATQSGCFIKVTAKDKVGWESSVLSETFSIDSTPPNVALENVNQVGEKALANYRSFDVGPAGFKSVTAYFRRKGQMKWEKGPTLTEAQGSFQFPGNPSDWETTMTAEDMVGNRTPEPTDATQAMELGGTNIDLFKNFRDGGYYKGGVQKPVFWETSAETRDILVKLSYGNDAVGWKVITEAAENTGRYYWTLPDVDSENIMLKLDAVLRDGRKITSTTPKPFNVDASPPRVSIEPIRYFSTRDINISFTAWDIGGSGVKSIVLYVGREGRMKPVKTVPYSRGLRDISSILDEGEYDVSIVAVDAVEHESDVKEGMRKIVVDTTPPTATLDNPANQYVFEGPGLVEWNYEVRDNFELQRQGVALEYSTDKVTWDVYRNLVPGKGVVPWRVPADEGYYYFRMRAVDNAGHRGYSDVKTVKVQLGKPEITKFTFSGDNSLVIAGETKDVSWEVVGFGTDPQGVSLHYSQDGGYNWTMIEKGLPLKTDRYQWIIPEVDAPYARLKLVAVNKKGVAEEKRSGSFQIFSKQVVPRIIAPPFTAEPNVKITYTVRVEQISKFSPPEFAELWYTSDEGKSWTCGERKKYSDAYFVFDASTTEMGSEKKYGFYIVIYSMDRVLNAKPVDALTQPSASVVFDRKKPAVTIGQFDERVFSPSGEIAIPYTVTDEYLREKSINLYYSCTGGADWTVMDNNVPNSGQYVWTIPAMLGPTEGCKFKVRIVAFDRAGNEGTAESAVFEVVRRLPPVRITGSLFKNQTPVPITFEVDNMQRIDIYQVIFYRRAPGEQKWELAGATQNPNQNMPVFLDLQEGEHELFAVLDTQFSIIPPERRREQDPAVILAPKPEDKAMAKIIVDTTPPEVKIVSFGKDETLFRGKALVPITWEVKDKNFSYIEIRVENEVTGKSVLLKEKIEDVVGTRRIMLDVETGHDYAVEVTAYDKAGNRSLSQLSRTRRFSVDGKAPDVVLKKGETKEGVVKVHYNLRDVGEAQAIRIDIYYRKKGAKEWMPFTTLPILSLKEMYFEFREKDGEYELYAAATDELGNVGPAPTPATTAIETVLLAKQIEVSLIGFEGPPPYRAGAVIAVNWVCREPNLGEKPVTFAYRESEADTWHGLAGEFPNTGSARITLPPDLNSKTCNLKIIVTNTYGQKGEDVLGHVFVVKSVPPGDAKIIEVEKGKYEQAGEPSEGAGGDLRVPRGTQPGTAPEGVRAPEGTRPPAPDGAEKRQEKPTGDLLVKADKLFGEMNYNDAIKLYRKALLEGENEAKAYYGLGRCYLKIGLPSKDVIESFKAALLTKPEWAMCLNDLGAVYFQGGDYENAAACFGKAVTSESSAPPKYYCNLGAALLHLGKYNEARTHLNKALALDQNYRDAYWYLAQIFTALRDWENAQLYWQRTLKYFEGDPNFGPIARENLKRAMDEVAAQKR